MAGEPWSWRRVVTVHTAEHGDPAGAHLSAVVPPRAAARVALHGSGVTAQASPAAEERRKKEMYHGP